jgi:large subunit ribosomal protein L21
MLGDGEAITLGEPTVAGASVNATLVETRKGEKVKIFKKIRRQGYRRTRGHRQFETVLRVTGLEAGEHNIKWDGVVDLTPKAVLDARARGLAPRTVAEAIEAEPVVEAAPAPAVEDEAPKKPRARKAKSDAAPEGDAGAEA